MVSTAPQKVFPVHLVQYDISFSCLRKAFLVHTYTNEALIQSTRKKRSILAVDQLLTK